MKRFLITYLLLVTSLLANAQFSGKGSGTAEDPYQISTPIHVDEIRNLAGVKDVCLVLTGDIDMTDYITENYGNAGWYPIPDFQGNLNGCGYTISGLRINRPTLDKVGFISTASFANFYNLTLEYAGDIIGCGISGAFIGEAGNCEIKRCGLVAKYIKSENRSSYIGSFVGYLGSGNIKECCCRFAEIKTYSGSVGGLLGGCNNTYIEDNMVTGRVLSVLSGVAGGVVGSPYSSTLNNNLFEGSVYANYCEGDYVGGLYGTDGRFDMYDFIKLASANVIIADTISITGSNSHIMRIGYASKNAAITSPQTNRASINTKLIAEGKELTVEDNKYNGLSTGQSMLKQKSLYANMGWDMDNVWSIDNGNSYPRLKWEAEKELMKTILTISNGEIEVYDGDVIRFFAEKKTANLPGGITYTYYQCDTDDPTIKNTSKQQQEVTVTVTSSDYKHLNWSGIDGNVADMSEATESRKVILESDGSLPLKLHATFADGDFTTYTANVTVSCKEYTKSFTIEFVNENPNKPVCPTPTITYSDGELSFECDCDGKPLYHVLTTSPDVKDVESAEDRLSLERTYNIEVYATASSYAPSDTARLTICWLDVENEDVDGTVEIKSIPIQVSYANGALQIKNVPINAKVELYDMTGILIRSVIANTSNIVVDIPHLNTYIIVRINNKSYKCKL